MTVSTALRFMAVRLLWRSAKDSFRLPRLVIAAGALALPALDQRSRRMIGRGRAGQIRLMLFLPGIFEAAGILRQDVHGVMQPGVKFRRNARSLDLAVIHHPTALAAVEPAAALQFAPAALAVIAVAELIDAGEFALEPGIEQGADVHAWWGKDAPGVSDEWGGLWRRPPAPSRRQAGVGRAWADPCLTHHRRRGSIPGHFQSKTDNNMGAQPACRAC